MPVKITSGYLSIGQFEFHEIAETVKPYLPLFALQEVLPWKSGVWSGLRLGILLRNLDCVASAAGTGLCHCTRDSSGPAVPQNDDICVDVWAMAEGAHRLPKDSRTFAARWKSGPSGPRKCHARNQGFSVCVTTPWQPKVWNEPTYPQPRSGVRVKPTA
jgi:hypothetical protein